MAKSTKRKGGLGRGLGSILSDADKGEKPVEIGKIPIDQIREVNPFQPRTQANSGFDQETLEDLAESIKSHGIIQPITVRKLGENQYQLIAGERRLRASKLANLFEIPAYIRTANDAQMLEMALIENVKREDLNPMEIALSYQRLVSELKLKQEELGTKVDKKRSTVANYLRLLKLPEEIQVGLRDRKISMGHARALISIGDPLQKIDLYREIINKSLSVRQTEILSRQLKEKTPKEEKTTKKAPSINDIHLKAVADSLEKKLGNKVRVNQKDSGNGEISIPFSTTEDLNRILEILDIF